ncbi:Alpha-N-acetylglucosaminidase [Morella rubra]|uniref:Alpha-N-acetylglucosaminidase n=1 Tax=Morella rubra TaxID=262757 RepID=A0A6A1WK61_9ROSI|nr:Alpha-N-acetylglucosaminidase [Morella rubra]
MSNFNSLFLVLMLTVALLPIALSEPEDPIQALLKRLNSKRSSPSVQEAAAEAVLERLLPGYVSSFEFKIISDDACGGQSCFLISNYKSLSKNGPQIEVKGSTAVEIASGLYWYLKYWCGAQVSWDKTGGIQIASIPKPGSLPLVKDEGVMIQRPVPWNYYQNVVTSSYSYVWWDWERWEKEIDWMALHGVNLPLAFTGQEAIWQKVFMNYRSSPTIFELSRYRSRFSIVNNESGFNISKEDLNDFFGGPAFLAWARMANLHGWGGPLSQNWLDQQLALQKRILSRMLELGMTPVLPSFSGNVPAALTKIFPSANITRLGNWGSVNANPRWCCAYLLDPSDPLFVALGEAFVRQQVEEQQRNLQRFPIFGILHNLLMVMQTRKRTEPLIFLVHVLFAMTSEYGDVTDIYNCDTFNENTPPTNDPKYISSLGASVFEAMSKGDKDAVWLMQGWLFYSDSSFWKPPQMKNTMPITLPIWELRLSKTGKCGTVLFKINAEALLHSVPFGKMIVLDLFADVKPIWKYSSQFYGTPYVWCMLHNFGGNIEMYGILDSISSGPVDARMSENSTMVGVGMCMEGIEQNPVVYELMSEMAFRSEKVQVLEWLKSYSRGRYGKAVHQVEAAWGILYHTIYNCTDGIADHNTDFIVKFPDWDPSKTSSALPEAHLWYSTEKVINALHLFLDGGNNLSGSMTYRYDLVDLTRQVLSKLANQVYLDAVTAFRQKDVKALDLHSQKFIELVKDIDILLASDDNFLLGTWLKSANKLAKNHLELRQYEWNARTQVTMWFDDTRTNQSSLHDYANKFWSGLLEGYYLPRASTYFHHLLKSLQENENFKIEEWRKEWISFSNKWQAGIELFPVRAEGDALAISEALYEKYFGLKKRKNWQEGSAL